MDQQKQCRSSRTSPAQRTIIGLAAILLAVAGCSNPAPSLESSPTSDPRASQLASAPGHSTAIPEAKTAVDCSLARAREDGAIAQANDLVIGPLIYGGLLHGYSSQRPDPADGIIFAKVGTELPPDASVTVSIAPESRSWAGIVTENGPPAGYYSVTYTSCPSSRQRANVWWVGGFALRNRISGCLPVEVQVEGETATRRAVIFLWDETCR